MKFIKSQNFGLGVLLHRDPSAYLMAMTTSFGDTSTSTMFIQPMVITIIYDESKCFKIRNTEISFRRSNSSSDG